MTLRRLRSGHEVLVRPVRPDDKRRLADAFERSSPESRHRRFLSPTNKLQSSQLQYLTEIDHHRHEGIQAVDPDTDKGVGVARFVQSPEDPSLAEVAVAVVDDWQGRGVGTVLLHDLAARAREEGVKRFSASVLAENKPMIEAFHRLGDVRVTGRDSGVVELLIELPAGTPGT